MPQLCPEVRRHHTATSSHRILPERATTGVFDGQNIFLLSLHCPFEQLTRSSEGTDWDLYRGKNHPKSVCPRFDIQKRPSFCKSVILIKIEKVLKHIKRDCVVF